MGTLILMNDVSTAMEQNGLVIGNLDHSASSLGNEQADQIARYLHSVINHVDMIYHSGALRLKKLVHKIQTLSRNGYLTKINPIESQQLRERSFGVINGTKYALEGELFKHTRMLAEDGESIHQCRNRGFLFVKTITDRYPQKDILVVSHPFFCQILCNSLLQKPHSMLTKFWIDKGSFVLFKFSPGSFGIKWELADGFNGISGQKYNQEEIYSVLSPEQRPSSS